MAIEQDELLAGYNSVLEALKAGRALNKILLAKGARSGSQKDVLRLAEERHVIIQWVEGAKLDEVAQGNRHQGVIALAAPIAYQELEDVLELAATRGEAPFVVVMDGLTDPHNVGAIIRTAAAAGVHGVLIPKRRNCPVTATVARTSAGAVEHVPIVQIGNVRQTLEKLKTQGLWVVGLDAAGDTEHFAADLKGPVALVVGSEGEGLGELVRRTCDFLVRIPMHGPVGSLNASVACALVLYEAFRQRR